MAADQLKAPSMLGYLAPCFANSTTLALSASTTWLAMQFVLDQTKTLSKIKLFLDTKNGTPTTAGCTADLYSDASGIPNASTEGPISADSVPASGNWMQWTSAGTSSLVAGTPYWIVFKNGTAIPGTNFPTYRYVAANGAGSVPPMPLGTGNLGAAAGVQYGWNKVHTINSGTAWASGLAYGVGGLRLEFTDGTFDGLPIQAVVRPSNGATADRAFGTQEAGVKFSVPAGATWNVRGAWFSLLKTGTPGNLRFRLYQGVTLLATTFAIPAGNVVTSNGDGYCAYFSATQTLTSANSPYRLVFGDATAGDANTLGYNSNVYTWENDANSLALKPMNGTLQKTITADNTANPVVFTDTSTDVLPFALLLDTAGELTGSSGGGLLLNSGMQGGLRG